ncbi:MAG: hypothetical protein WCH39_03465 [Schlesneria sp.]
MKKFIIRVMSVTVLAGSVVGVNDNAHACDKRVTYYQPAAYYQPASYTVVTQPAPPVQTTVVSQTSITAVVVSAAKPTLPEVPAGSSMRIKVNFLGNQTGHVFLNVGKLVMECKIEEWNPSYAVFALPDLGLLEATEATIDVTKSDGLVARSTKVKLTPTQDVEVLEPVAVIPRAVRKVSARVPAVTGGLEVPPTSDPAPAPAPPRE